jgi:sugar/nucleoside kinase (ribokinase family)
MKTFIIGVLNTELIVTGVDQPFALGKQVSFKNRLLRYAGAGSNVAKALAALGGTPCLRSAVGNDHDGRAILQDLAGAGVETSGIMVLPDRYTGLAVVVVDGSGERGIISDAGAMKHYSVACVREGIRGAVKGDRVLMTGLFVAPQLLDGGLADLFAELRRTGVTTLLDPGWSPEGYPAVHRERVFSFLPHIDYFLPNESEVTAVAGNADVDRAIDILLTGYPDMRIITKLGARGCLYADRRARRHQPAYRVAAQDCTGAGDAFSGGMLYGLERTWPLTETLDLACATAGHVVSKLENRYGDFNQINEVRTCVPRYPEGTLRVDTA